MGDNGSSNGGGNTSVYWEVRDGTATNPRPPKPHSGPPPASRGQVKVHSVVEGHTDHNFSDIGLSVDPTKNHPGLFRVVLRFRNVDWGRVPAAERAWLQNVTQDDGTNRYLTVHVPAIQRAMPEPNGQWSDMPWEIHWEW